jgi:hypothetical protein
MRKSYVYCGRPRQKKRRGWFPSMFEFWLNFLPQNRWR